MVLDACGQVICVLGRVSSETCVQREATVTQGTVMHPGVTMEALLQAPLSPSSLDFILYLWKVKGQ